MEQSAAINNLEKYKLQRECLQDLLRSKGIEIPLSKTEGEPARSILLRGDTSFKHLTQSEPFEPFAGEMGTFGVFLGDNLAVLPLGGIYYVYKNLPIDWVEMNSNKFTELRNKTASEKGLDTKTIGGSVEADTCVYKQVPVYDSQQGIYTLPNELDVIKASMILIHKKYESVIPLERIRPELRSKISMFDWPI
jgi:hypothetical protein